MTYRYKISLSVIFVSLFSLVHCGISRDSFNASRFKIKRSEPNNENQKKKRDRYNKEKAFKEIKQAISTKNDKNVEKTLQRWSNYDEFRLSDFINNNYQNVLHMTCRNNDYFSFKYLLKRLEFENGKQYRSYLWNVVNDFKDGGYTLVELTDETFHTRNDIRYKKRILEYYVGNKSNNNFNDINEDEDGDDKMNDLNNNFDPQVLVKAVAKCKSDLVRSILKKIKLNNCSLYSLITKYNLFHTCSLNGDFNTLCALVESLKDELGYINDTKKISDVLWKMFCQKEKEHQYKSPLELASINENYGQLLIEEMRRYNLNYNKKPKRNQFNFQKPNKNKSPNYGLNLELICVACGDKMFINKGFGRFSLEEIRDDADCTNNDCLGSYNKANMIKNIKVIDCNYKYNFLVRTNKDGKISSKVMDKKFHGQKKRFIKEGTTSKSTPLDLSGLLKLIPVCYYAEIECRSKN